MTWRLTLTALGATLALGAITPATAQNLITNGGFENQPGFTGGGYDYSPIPIGWTTNAAWDANPLNGVVGSVYGVPHSGNDSVRFGSSYTTTPTALSQTFADVIGAIYTVSFYAYDGLYAGVAGSRPQNYLTASAGGQSLTLPDNVGGNSGIGGCDASCYALGTFTFVGAGSDTLSLATKADYNYWHLDDVSVTLLSLPTPPDTGAVPEPATWAMMMVGFGTVGAGLRRRRRQGKLAFG